MAANSTNAANSHWLKTAMKHVKKGAVFTLVPHDEVRIKEITDALDSHDALLEACKAFHELFNDSDMRPEDECHELYEKVSEAIALATPAARKEE